MQHPSPISEQTTRRRRNRRLLRSGLALIDLTVSVLLIGILTAAVVPRFSEALQHTRLSSAAARVCADIRYARSTALATSAAKRIDFSVPLHSYTLVGVPSPDRPGTDYTVLLGSGAYDTQIVSASLGGDASLTFDLHGQPDSGGTLVLRAGGVQKTITINAATGEATTP